MVPSTHRIEGLKKDRPLFNLETLVDEGIHTFLRNTGKHQCNSTAWYPTRPESLTNKVMEISNLALQSLVYMELPYQNIFCKTFCSISSMKNILTKYCEEIFFIQMFI
jgi:hypothetical protein